MQDSEARIIKDFEVKIIQDSEAKIIQDSKVKISLKQFSLELAYKVPHFLKEN